MVRFARRSSCEEREDRRARNYQEGAIDDDRVQSRSKECSAGQRQDWNFFERASNRGRRSANSFLLKSNRSEEHTSELQSQSNLVCRLLLEKKNEWHSDDLWSLL